MRTVKWNAFLSGLCGLAVALGVMAASARADVTTEKGASILIFPKVRADSTFDTIIQISNTSNRMVHALCFYVNASLFNIFTGLPCTVPSSTCVPQWQETDFLIWLTRQQPTHWVVSTGRKIDLTDDFATDGSGLDPGLIPPVTEPFTGELKCIEVADTGEPVTSNDLKGEATIETVSGGDRGDVSKYNAIGIQGNPDTSPSNPLLLDGGTNFDACPAKLIVNHLTTTDGVVSPDDTSDPVGAEFGIDTGVSTELTLVPCSEDFENQLPTSSVVQFLVTNEFEQRFSASTTVNCFLNTELLNIGSATGQIGSVFSASNLGTDVATTEITPVPFPLPDGSVNVQAVVGVIERFTSTGASTARAAYNLHTTGDLIPPSGPPNSIQLTTDLQ